MRKYILIPVIIYLMLLFLWPYFQLAEDNDKAVKTHAHVQAYIDSFQSLAIEEMKYSGVPASITLAQGMLESNYGRSELAKRANNHFGIKCKKQWGFNRYNIYSDEWNPRWRRMEPKMSCFRVYESPAHSFRDHSDFLRKGPRYEHLFSLNRRDYKAWARGLQKAGYATDPEYAKKLMLIIRRNKLYELDR